MLVVSYCLPLSADNISVRDMSSLEIVSAIHNLKKNTGKSDIDININDGSTTTLHLTAPDMVTKIYGLVPYNEDIETTIKNLSSDLNIIPERDGQILWVEKRNGDIIDYYGLHPEVYGLALVDGRDLTEFTYFFQFPYIANEREAVNLDQSSFSGLLLQEMQDTGFDMGVNILSSDIFEAIGEYNGNLIDVRLLEDVNDTDGSGEFILCLTVDSNGYDEVAEIPAL